MDYWSEICTTISNGLENVLRKLLNFSLNTIVSHWWIKHSTWFFDWEKFYYCGYFGNIGTFIGEKKTRKRPGDEVCQMTNLSQANKSVFVDNGRNKHIHMFVGLPAITFCPLTWRNLKSFGSVSAHLLLMGWIENQSNECDYPNAKLDENVMIKGQRVELWKDGEWANTNNKY